MPRNSHRLFKASQTTSDVPSYLHYYSAPYLCTCLWRTTLCTFMSLIFALQIWSDRWFRVEGASLHVTSDLQQSAWWCSHGYLHQRWHPVYDSPYIGPWKEKMVSLSLIFLFWGQHQPPADIGWFFIIIIYVVFSISLAATSIFFFFSFPLYYMDALSEEALRLAWLHFKHLAG